MKTISFFEFYTKQEKRFYIEAVKSIEPLDDRRVLVKMYTGDEYMTRKVTFEE